MPDLKLACNPIYMHNSESGQEAFLLFGENGEEKIAVMDDMLYNAIEQEFSKKIDDAESRYVYDYEWAKEYINEGTENEP